MSSLLIRNARVLTLSNGDLRQGRAEAPLGASAPMGQPDRPRRGHGMHELGIIDRGYVRVSGDRIAEVEHGEVTPRAGETVIDTGGRVVMPAFVDCHTHACWAGDRFDEFEQRQKGATYLEILQAGGGIMSTVRAVRAASEDELVNLLERRLARMLALGTGTIEIKSGYGLDTDNELKMLRAIRRVSREWPGLIVPTFLGAHAIDRDQPDFIERTINQTLRAVVEEFPGITCDAYCEDGAWSLDQARRLFENAVDLGCPLRVHTDQFHSLGMTRLAVEMGARSVDHLEAITPDDLTHLARSATIGVALPCSGFQLDDRYAPARALIDAGGALAIATNYNPGSAPTPSMPFTLALACRKLQLSVAEAIAASTWNAACVLGIQDEVGSLEPDKRADLQILDSEDERELGFEFAAPGPRMVILEGRVVADRSPEI